MQLKTQATISFFTACLAITVTTAWGESQGNWSVWHENCPADFDVVDLGRWTTNEAGDKKLDYGGVLYQVTRSDSPWQDLMSCVHLDDLDGRVQILNGKPVPLVRAFLDGDIGLRYIRRPYGDYVGDVVHGYLITVVPEGSPLPKTEERNRNDFLGWLRTSDDRGNTVALGPNYTCLFDPKNPTLVGDGSYACLVTIDEAPFPHSFIRCGRWVGGCSAEFSLSQEVVVRLSGDYLDHWEEADRVTSIPEVIEFWSILIDASVSNFEASVVPRGREEFISGSN